MSALTNMRMLSRSHIKYYIQDYIAIDRYDVNSHKNIEVIICKIIPPVLVHGNDCINFLKITVVLVVVLSIQN